MAEHLAIAGSTALPAPLRCALYPADRLQVRPEGGAIAGQAPLVLLRARLQDLDLRGHFTPFIGPRKDADHLFGERAAAHRYTEHDGSVLQCDQLYFRREMTAGILLHS